MKRLKKQAGSVTDKIVEIIKNMSEPEQLEVQNTYCDSNNYSEFIYPMDMFDEYFGNLTYREVKEMMADDFDEDKPYFYVDDLGKINSTDKIFEAIEIEDIADWIFDRHDLSDLPDALQVVADEVENFEGYK